MNIVVRPAIVADLSNIVDLHVRSWRENYTKSLSPGFLNSTEVEVNRTAIWKKRLNELSLEQYVIIAEINGSFAGFLCLYLNKHSVLGTLIDNLHVEPKFRKQGIGRHLMRDAAYWISQQKQESKIYLEAYAENERAQKFYRGLAATKTTEQPFLVAAVDGGEALTFHFTWDSPAVLMTACEIALNKNHRKY